MKLSLNNAVIAYDSNVVLRDVNLTISRGEACSLRGPNGSGKTSLIRCLLGLRNPRRGERVCDFRKIGYVPQTRAISGDFPISVERCLEMSFPGFTYLWNKNKRRLMREKIRTALEAAGIAHRAERMLRECSGGELQRTLIARALVHEPELLVLDEPTNSLDAKGKREIMKLLMEFNRNQKGGILMTTHETDNALPEMNMFTKRIIIENGTANVEKSGDGKN